MKKIDLHIHSNLSDGNLDINNIIKLAKNNTCNMIAITDHDQIVDYTKESKVNNISILSGVEFNSSFNRLHILGYNVQDINKLQDFLYNLNARNEKICIKVIQMLQEDGFDISVNQVVDYITSINLPCQIIDKKKITKYLVNRGYAKNTLDTYDTLIGKNQKYYVPIYKLNPDEIIKMVHLCGGFTVLAHPGTLNLSNRKLYKLVSQLKDFGLEGIEIINTKMNDYNNLLYSDIANQLHLIKTVGSDFHTPENNNIGIEVSEEIIESIQKKLLKTS